MDAIAVLIPALEQRFDRNRRNALLTAHATQLLRACEPGAHGRIFAVANTGVHELLGRLESLRPSHVLVEHSPFSYGAEEATALAAAAWAHAHRLNVHAVSHPEYGRHSDAHDAPVVRALGAAAPLFAQTLRIFCHDAAWARTLAQRVPSCAQRIKVLEDWSVLTPGTVRPVDADAPQLLLVDALARAQLAKLFAAAATGRRRYRVAMLYGGEAGRQRLEGAIEDARAREWIVPLAALTDEHLAAAIAECSRVVIAALRQPSESARWARTAVAFGRSVTILDRNGESEQIERTVQTRWAAIAHAILVDERERALAASLEEDVEEPTIGI